MVRTLSSPPPSRLDAVHSRSPAEARVSLLVLPFFKISFPHKTTSLNSCKVRRNVDQKKSGVWSPQIWVSDHLPRQHDREAAAGGPSLMSLARRGQNNPNGAPRQPLQVSSPLQTEGGSRSLHHSVRADLREATSLVYPHPPLPPPARSSPMTATLQRLFALFSEISPSPPISSAEIYRDTSLAHLHLASSVPAS